jgi:hypothetical protein
LTPLITISLLSGGMWLAGCGEFSDDEPIHLDEFSVEANDDNLEEEINQGGEEENAAANQNDPIENADDPVGPVGPDDPAEQAEALDFDKVNANQWQQVGSLNRAIVDIARTDDHLWALTSWGDLYRSSDGENWEEQYMSGHSGEQIAAAGNDLLMITDDGEFLHLFENEGSWYPTEPLHLNRGNSTSLFTVGNAVVASFSPKLLSGGKGTGTTPVGGGLYLADSHEQDVAQWYKLDADLPREDEYSQNAPVFSVYADAYLYLVIGYGGIYRYDETSTNWEPAASGGGLPQRYLNSDSSHLTGTYDTHFAVVDLGDGVELYRSENRGIAWHPVDHDLPESTTVFALESHGPTLLMGTDSHGVLASNDDGLTWTPLGEDYDSGQVLALEVEGSLLRAATSSGVAELALD